MPKIEEPKKKNGKANAVKAKAVEAKPKPKTAPEARDIEREVLYPDYEAELCIGDNALTVEQAKAFLGWEEEPEGVRFTDYVPELVPLYGRRVRFRNNTKNRYLTPSWLLTLKQEHLNRRWRFNGESISIGRTGNVCSGQHRFISLVLAEQERLGEQEHHWTTLWPGPVTMECLIVKGINEDDDTFKTLNCGKPGTLSEILYRSEYFSKMKPGDRKTAARTCEGCIKLLWHRTGAGLDAFAPRRTHGEAMDFLARHGKIVRAVRHIFEEDKDGHISRKINPGAAAGLMYLMAASASDLDSYRAAEPKPHEKVLDLSNWDKAEEFWVLVSSGSGPFEVVKEALAFLDDPDTGSFAGKLEERLAVICKAWVEWIQGNPVSKSALELKYAGGDDGERYLDECPTVGGIDLGNPRDAETVDTEEEAEAAQEETEVETTKEEAVETPAQAFKKADKEAVERRKKAEKAAATIKERRDNGKYGDKKRTTPADDLRSKQRADALKADQELAKKGNKKAAEAVEKELKK